MPRIRISAPGKIILTGEHSVVYGKPALVAAIDRRLEISAKWNKIDPILFKKLLNAASATGAVAILHHLQSRGIVSTIHSDIPIGSGMGSSAALAVGLSALLHRLTEMKPLLEDINASAFEMETFAHGTPSGIDNTVITYGGLLQFQRTKNGFVQKKLDSTTKPLRLLVINTGKPIETTKEMVHFVRDRLEQYPNDTAIIDEISVVTKRIESLIVSGNTNESLSSAIAENERLLEKLGVVSTSTQKLIRKIESFGGAAKISGAGGIRGVSGIILALHTDSDWLREKLSQLGFETLPATISPTGLTIEEQ